MTKLRSEIRKIIKESILKEFKDNNSKEIDIGDNNGSGGFFDEPGGGGEEKHFVRILFNKLVEKYNYQRDSNENRPNYKGPWPEGIPYKNLGKGIKIFFEGFDETTFGLLVTTSVIDSPKIHGWESWDDYPGDNSHYTINIGYDIKIVQNLQEVNYYLKYLRKLEDTINRKSLEEIISDISKITGFPEYPDFYYDDRGYPVFPKEKEITDQLFNKYVGHKDFYSLKVRRKGFDDGDPSNF